MMQHASTLLADFHQAKYISYKKNEEVHKMHIISLMSYIHIFGLMMIWQ